jgi:hypothetical protein
MKTIEADVAVGLDGTAVIQFQVAPDVCPGIHHAVVVLEEAVADEESTRGATSLARGPLQSPYGVWADLRVDIAAEEIAEARREMWRAFPREDILAGAGRRARVAPA